ncbi:MAG TPA: hypothetical protein VL523_08850 [Terriglobia bacterium]|nr:hypothetical protein [Terriglobia bacterium]
MKAAALGVRVHSGWGALVAVTGERGAAAVIHRQRVVVTDSKVPGAVQPYHRAEKMKLPEAEKYLADFASAADRLAAAAVGEIVQALEERGFRVAGSAILLASGRPLPPLAAILRSHAMIHTAEGEFFRMIFRRAFGTVGLPVYGFRERELEHRAEEALGRPAAELRQDLQTLGKNLGPPWTADQKNAALAAWIVLASGPARAAK